MSVTSANSQGLPSVLQTAFQKSQNFNAKHVSDPYVVPYVENGKSIVQRYTVHEKLAHLACDPMVGTEADRKKDILSDLKHVHHLTAAHNKKEFDQVMAAAHGKENMQKQLLADWSHLVIV